MQRAQKLQSSIANTFLLSSVQFMKEKVKIQHKLKGLHQLTKFKCCS